MTISINLLPEFGWSICDRQIIGPGSVFQGHIELQLSETLKMDRLRLIFRAQESLVPYEIAPGIVRSKSTSLFTIHQILWDSKDGHRSRNAGNYSHPFTIQMPMTQYPPSTDNKFYGCTFKLIAVVESQQHEQQYETLLMKEQVMLYMPFVETTLLKRPLITTQHESGLNVVAKLHSLDYVPGDSILGTVTINSSSPISKKQLRVSLSLYQTITNLLFKDVPDSIQLVASTSINLSPVYDNSGDSSNSTYSSSLELDIPISLTPSFTYSKLSSTTYRLCLSVKRKGPLSIWSQGVKMDWPLTIGTLGAGVRSSSDLTLYSALNGVADHDQFTPKFVKAVEYEHALPIYEPSQLPDYEEPGLCGDVSSDLV
ncbi:hypothetical protein BCR42DRAFT_405887 [Absidia repens]|uniref:Arrestin C-terminal-like domain-containing protein n=1 Tax=Absidia repens TaxID=90262 RepID=A0A1X2IU65_9FUNG|nr:hypothetical protein BCR42DRAFT_405887 [Absidia repens]